jgi:uroporphyrinogen-III synthase
MRVLVTRPLNDARETELQLKLRGHSCVIAPLLVVNFFDGPALDLTDVQAILATSANGVRALARRTARRDVPVFAVGPQTTEAARHAGFAIVKNADGDANALARAVLLWLSADRGLLLHACGTNTDGALATALRASGFTVRSAVLYEVVDNAELPPAAREAIADGCVAAVLFYSPRSARVFAACVAAAGLADAASRMLGVCISKATALALTPLAMGEIRIAQKPNQAALLDCLG